MSDPQAEVLRRQSWRGLKAPVKRLIGLRLPHLLLRGVVKLRPERFDVGRLPAPAHLRMTRARMGGTSFVMLAPGRCILAKELYWGEGQRPRARDQLALDTFAALAGGADLVLDVGAYTGIFSILAARVCPAAQVHAFEIVPAVAQAALANVVANDVVTRVTVHLCGVGRADTTVTMATGSGGSALPDFYSAQMEFTDGVRIPVRSLDDLQRVLDPADQADRVLMKIDTEGGESAVLLGAGAFLTRYEPDMICEVLAEKAQVDALRQVLREHRYTAYRLEDSALRRVDELMPHPEYRDWLFTRASAEQLVRRGVSIADR